MEHVGKGPEVGTLYGCDACEAECFCEPGFTCVRCAIAAEERKLQARDGRRRNAVIAIGATVAGLFMMVLLATGGLLVANSAVRALHDAQSVEADGSFTINNTSCNMKDSQGYNDIQPGQLVKITDETGKQIGAASLGPCVDGTDGTSAVFSFSTDVPKADSYGFTVADRGTVQYTYDQVKNENVTLTLD